MKKENISKEKYIETFCRDKRIRDRQVIYVSREVHERISKVADLFSEQYVTVSSLADTILAHHIETHRQMFEALRQKEHEEFRQWPKKRNTDSENEEREEAAGE